MVLKVINIGPLATVQDAGRNGFQRYGVTQSGPMDRISFEIANRLVGNEINTALIEFAGYGGVYQTDQPILIAGAGGEFPVKINGKAMGWWRSYLLEAGAKIEIGASAEGNYGYLAVAGGFPVPKVMGSRSTHTRAGFGGWQGRPLKVGDELPLSGGPLLSERLLSTDHRPSARTDIRIIWGAQADYFDSAELQKFTEQSYQITSKMDRMGVHLEGQPLNHRDSHDTVSDGIVNGSIQIPGSGIPIVLLADRQPTGGYSKIATIITADIPAFAQIRPDASCRFIAVDEAAAIEALKQMREYLGNVDTHFTDVSYDMTSEGLLSVNLISGVVG